MKVLFLFGTRPEAIKLCPVLLHMRQRPEQFEVKVCVTAQHREMLDRVLSVFGVTPDYDLNVMQPGQTLLGSTARILGQLEAVFADANPELAVVQGDTTTTFCGALAAFFRRVPVAHVEAGLRTGDIHQPFPEEANRLLTAQVTTLHFAATEWAAGNLRHEHFPGERIWVTGNSGIDAVLHVRQQLENGKLPATAPPVPAGKKRILVTAHRRENFGEPFRAICRALATLAQRPDVEIVFPTHPNPNVQEPVQQILAGRPNITLLPPQDYVPFIDLMRSAYLLITDSGGVQEEGPSLGKPILVLREKTERPEAVKAGTVKLVGTDEAKILAEAGTLLDSPEAYQAMARVHNPYGDGQASRRIADGVLQYFAARQ